MIMMYIIFWRSLLSFLAFILFYDAIRQVNAAVDSRSLVNSSWLWAEDALTSFVPANETIALRRIIVAPQGKGLKSADIVMTADNDFSLYIDGNLIGSRAQVSNANDWQSAKRFVVGLAGNSALFAVLALNYPADGTTDGSGSAGFIGVIAVTYSDGTTATVRTDTSWKLSKTVDEEFQLPSTDDSNWGAATSLGLYGDSGIWSDSVEIPALSNALTTSLSASSTVSATVSSTSTHTPTPAPTPTQSTPASDTSAKSKSKTPVIAGAVVGGVLLSIIAFVLLRFLITRRRRVDERIRNEGLFGDGKNTKAQVELDPSSQIPPFKQRNPSLSAIPFLLTSSSSNLSSTLPSDVEQGISTTTRTSGKAGKLSSTTPLAPPAAPYANASTQREQQSAESIATLRERIQALEQVMHGPVVEAQIPMMNQYAFSDNDDGMSVPPPYDESPPQHQRGMSEGSRSGSAGAR